MNYAHAHGANSRLKPFPGHASDLSGAYLDLTTPGMLGVALVPLLHFTEIALKFDPACVF